jgi:hypothetical protein
LKKNKSRGTTFQASDQITLKGCNSFPDMPTHEEELLSMKDEGMQITDFSPMITNTQENPD